MRRNKDRMLRGFARIHLKNPDGSVAVERTMENQFSDAFRQELLSEIGAGGAMGFLAAAIGVGTGGAVTGSHTSLPGELNSSANSAGANIASDTALSGSSRLRVTGQFASDKVTGNISNMGLNSSTAAGGSLLCGNTFSASFAKATNQTLSVTYDITFSS